MKHIIKAILIVSVSLPTFNSCNNKLVYFISSPRSLSVSFTRMMQQRGDFSIFHEPCQCAFNTITWPDLASTIYKDTAPKTFETAKQLIIDESLQKPVFVKEMVIAAKHFLMHDEVFVTQPDVYFVFLIRSPHAVITSYCKTRLSLTAADVSLPSDLSDRVGCKAMYELLHFIQKKAVHPPLLILTEDLYTNPTATVQAFCNHVDIAYDEQAMQWQDLGPDFDGAQEWHEYKHKDTVHRWHGTAIHSTGFTRPALYDVDEQGNPTFKEIKELKPEWLSFAQTCYEANIIYYKALLAEFKEVLPS